MNHSKHSLFIWATLSGSMMALSWLAPATFQGAILGWMATFFLVAATVHKSASYSSQMLIGIIQNTIAFYWMVQTIQKFGGFNLLLALSVYALFVVLSSLQNVIYLFIYRNIPRLLDSLSLRCAFAWATSEVLSVRIFPWYIGHTQLNFTWLAQAADLSGVILISFIMLWASESIYRVITEPKNYRVSIASFLALAALLYYGSLRFKQFESVAGDSLSVTIVQANISVEKKANIHFFTENREEYESITASLPRRPELIIWPESVIQDFIYENVQHVRNDSRLPYFESRHLLTGTLTFRSKNEIFNSSLGIFSDGTVSKPYHKQILMPFGEYMPFSSVFPWLLELNPSAGNFSAGTEIALIEFPELPPHTPRSFKVAPLICYEDVVPSLSRQATRRGAEVLINLTNDAWFGNTIAPFQHHLIASFRAIENRRYLVRSTNSGLTAIVNPRGQTIGSLPPFTEGWLSRDVKLITVPSAYSAILGEIPWWIFSILSAFSAIFTRFSARLYATRD